MLHPSRPGRRAPWALVAAALLLIPAPAAAQIPDEFMNLELLPADITKPELVATMRGWADALGVRCSHCHVGPDTLEGMDFASDERASKRATREMLILTRAINDDFLKLPPGPDRELSAVTCYTCHRGMTGPPRAVEAEVASAVERGGVAAAVDRVRTLHERHYGAGRYDLSAGNLGGIALGFLEEERGEDALEMLALGLELHPDSSEIHAAYGRAYAALGQKERARESYEKALELDRRNRDARRGLRELESAQEQK